MSGLAVCSALECRCEEIKGAQIKSIIFGKLFNQIYVLNTWLLYQSCYWPRCMVRRYGHLEHSKFLRNTQPEDKRNGFQSDIDSRMVGGPLTLTLSASRIPWLFNWLINFDTKTFISVWLAKEQQRSLIVHTVHKMWTQKRVFHQFEGETDHEFKSSVWKQQKEKKTT